MIFEKAKAEDIADLVKLRIDYLLEDYGDIPSDQLSVISDRLPAYFQCHLNRDLIAFVCRDGDIFVACCFLYVSEKPPNPAFPHGKIGTVLNVYTKPAYRRRGIAGKLMKALLSEAEEMGLDFVELKATDAGYPLYRSLGFKDVSSKYHSMKYAINA
ncbi:MAG: GNAT family N-acetyltransferase [Clostridia bacterium]|nr:GNAT family N-acetyltransferase [Clostridia bacterium]